MSGRIVILGGGAIGSAVAYFLARIATANERITVIERDPTYRVASSSLSASSIRQQFSTPLNVKLSQFGYDFMRSCVAGDQLGGAVGLHECGYMFLARADQAGAMKLRTRLVREFGGKVEEFDARKLAERYRWLCCDGIAYAVMGLSGEGWFDGYMLQQWYRTRAQAGGVEYIRGDVIGLECTSTKVVSVQLAGGMSIPAERVVNACGPWSAAIARYAGIDLPVRARRRSLFVVSCPEALPGFPILVDTSGVFIRPELQHFLCALSPREERDYDDLPLEPDLELFEDQVWPALALRVPAFEALRVVRAWSGYYEFNVADQNGLVGQIGPENFYVATGFSGHGLMHSAGIGRGMAELLTYGEYRQLDLSPLSPQRVHTGRLIVEDAVY